MVSSTTASEAPVIMLSRTSRWPGKNNDGAVPLHSEEILGGEDKGHHQHALLRLTIHDVGKCEGSLAETLGISLELLQTLALSGMKRRNISGFSS